MYKEKKIFLKRLIFKMSEEKEKDGSLASDAFQMITSSSISFWVIRQIQKNNVLFLRVLEVPNKGGILESAHQVQHCITAAALVDWLTKFLDT